jgi:hypothetical protein
MKYLNENRVEMSQAEYDVQVADGKRFAATKLPETIDGKIIRHPALKQFTADQETLRDSEEAQNAIDNPHPPPSKEEMLWSKAMKASDNILPRWGEDILDGMDKSGVAQILLDRLQSKKDLRATKP